jgi:hypothetical protein
MFMIVTNMIVIFKYDLLMDCYKILWTKTGLKATVEIHTNEKSAKLPTTSDGNSANLSEPNEEVNSKSPSSHEQLNNGEQVEVVKPVEELNKKDYKSC